MKHYRSYMDRITAPAGLRQRVLEAAEQLSLIHISEPTRPY